MWGAGKGLRGGLMEAGGGGAGWREQLGLQGKPGQGGRRVGAREAAGASAATRPRRRPQRGDVAARLAVWRPRSGGAGLLTALGGQRWLGSWVSGRPRPALQDRLCQSASQRTGHPCPGPSFTEAGTATGHEGDPTVPFIQTAASPAASFSAESGVLDRGGLRPPPVKTLDWRLGGEAAPPQGGKWIFLCHPQLLP